MWLLDTLTLRLRFHHVPPKDEQGKSTYAILSHVWDAEGEQSFQVSGFGVLFRATSVLGLQPSRLLDGEELRPDASPASKRTLPRARPCPTEWVATMVASTLPTVACSDTANASQYIFDKTAPLRIEPRA
ncbi:hypothetical protein C8Q73DRAFT_535437 [Cubamyces lactineus]|nr:hypothetical protein C8Q73DRAFT_535437 [Cubamyces lactineus]